MSSKDRVNIFPSRMNLGIMKAGFHNLIDFSESVCVFSLNFPNSCYTCTVVVATYYEGL